MPSGQQSSCDVEVTLIVGIYLGQSCKIATCSAALVPVEHIAVNRQLGRSQRRRYPIDPNGDFVSLEMLVIRRIESDLRRQRCSVVNRHRRVRTLQGMLADSSDSEAVCLRSGQASGHCECQRWSCIHYRPCFDVGDGETLDFIHFQLILPNRRSTIIISRFPLELDCRRCGRNPHWRAWQTWNSGREACYFAGIGAPACLVESIARQSVSSLRSQPIDGGIETSWIPGSVMGDSELPRKTIINKNNVASYERISWRRHGSPSNRARITRRVIYGQCRCWRRLNCIDNGWQRSQFTLADERHSTDGNDVAVAACHACVGVG